MTGITLGEGWLPKRPYPVEDAPPASVEMNDTAALLSAIKDALSQFAANTMAPTQLPPVVTAPQPVDLSPVLEALNRPVGLSADDLRSILASIPPAPAAPDTSAQLEVLTGVAEALKTLDFRMRGTGGGGSLSPDITDRGNRILGHVTVDQMPALTVAPSTSVDLFGTNIVGELNNLVEVHYDDAAWATFVTQTVTTTGTATQANGRVAFNSGTSSTGRMLVTSVDVVKYRPHFPTYAAFTAAFVTPPTNAADRAYLGLGDTTNGFFIGYSGTQFGIILRQNSVDTFIPQGSFNGAASTFNPALGNIYKIEVGLFGYAGGHVHVFDPVAYDWITLHTIKYANTSAEPLFTNFDLPMTLDVDKSSANTTNIQINTACWGAGSTSLQERMTDTLTDRSLAQTTRSVIVGKTTGGGGAYVPVKVNPSGALTVAATQDAPNTHANGWETRDYFTSGQVLADQTAAGAALTFTFTTPVQLVQVMTTGVEGRADPFGGTPTSTTGIRVLADTPTLIPVQTSSVQVFAASGGVSVTGFRY